MNVNTARSVLRQYSSRDIYLALILDAIDDVKSMYNDLVNDKEYLEAEGFPSKADVIARIVDVIVNVQPEQVAEQIPMSCTQAIPCTGVEHIPTFTRIMKDIVTVVVDQAPELITFRVVPR